MTMMDTLFFIMPLCLPCFYSQVSLTKRNFIGLNRARRPHNAIFVSFVEPNVPSECLDAAMVNWRQVCVKDQDKEAEEKLKKVGAFIEIMFSGPGKHIKSLSMWIMRIK